MAYCVDEWKEWPSGEEAHNIHPDKLICPICYHKLTPREKFYQDEDTEAWSFTCDKCKTQYVSQVEIGHVSLPVSPEERIKQLEERVTQLENILRELLRSEHLHKTSKSAPITSNEITDKYSYLLH